MSRIHDNKVQSILGSAKWRDKLLELEKKADFLTSNLSDDNKATPVHWPGRQCLIEQVLNSFNKKLTYSPYKNVKTTPSKLRPAKSIVDTNRLNSADVEKESNEQSEWLKKMLNLAREPITLCNKTSAKMPFVGSHLILKAVFDAIDRNIFNCNLKGVELEWCENLESRSIFTYQQVTFTKSQVYMRCSEQWMKHYTRKQFIEAVMV